jgi:phosphoribosylanthranilate isomerase
MSVQAKICGIKTPEALNAAIEGGARMVGFVFFPPSPRHVSIDTAKELALMLPTGMRCVALFVDPTDEQHGDETPKRVSEIKTKYAMPIIKAFPVREAADIDRCADYADADWFLFDAKPVDADLPGGTGQRFDWGLLDGKGFDKPWMLSGGLTPDNVGDALSVLSPRAVDVSSGVERERGVKDEDKIRAFLDTVNAL